MRKHGSRGCIPGWSEHVEPLRKNSLFWHNMWIECGRPHDGTVANIMRKTRAKYHYAIREVRRKEAEIVNRRFASALTENRNRDFWHEAKRIRNSKNKVSSVVDDCCNADGVANLFCTKYQELYTSVSCDNYEMMEIRYDIDKSLTRNGVYFSRICTSIGRSAQICSVLLKVRLHDLGVVNRRLVWQLYNRDLYRYEDDIHVICELLAVKHGDLELDMFSNLSLIHI